MLDHPHLIHPRALRSSVVRQTSTNIPRLWPDLPISVQIQLAKQMAQLLSRLTASRPLPVQEGLCVDCDDRD